MVLQLTHLLKLFNCRQRRLWIFIRPNFLPPNSLSLNPVDYKIRENNAREVFKTKSSDIEELCGRIVNAWEEFDQLVINAVTSQWHARREAFVEAEGGHVETQLAV